MNLNSFVIPVDKANHALYGGVVFTIFLVIFTFVGAQGLFPEDYARWLAAGLVVLVAFGKELFDWGSNAVRARQNLPPNHGVEWGDAFATALGGAFPLVCTFFGTKF